MRTFMLATALIAGFGLATAAQAQTVQILEGDITADTFLRRDVTYVLRGAVFVREPATLNVEPGTTIVGEKASNGTLIIAQGARLIAKGTADAPIVFTSDQPVGQRARADWGGLIINGRAPLNVPGGLAEGEGDTGVYGGEDPNDSSGELGYLRVEFAGTEFSPDNELNGIAFQGVGAGTFVDYVQVHFNKDDGFEWFGGTVSCKHLVSTGIADDSFDWTEGWTGRGQFWVAQQRGDDADQGIEGDSNAENNDLLPRSFPRLFNVTLIGDPDSNEGDESDIGMLLREGTAGIYANFIVLGFKEIGLEIDQRATFTQAAAGDLVLASSIFHGNGQGNFSDDAKESFTPPFSTAQFARDISANVAEVDPMLTDPFNLEAPNFLPMAGSPAIDGSIPVATPPAEEFYEAVDYIGAFGTEDWTAGWTTFAQS